MVGADGEWDHPGSVNGWVRRCWRRCSSGRGSGRGPDDAGAWLRGWRLLAIDGFEVDVLDSPANAAEFGYAGSGPNRSAFPKARVVALAECGTHAFLAAEVGACSVGEKTLAARLYPRLRRDELLTADRNFYSFDAWGLAAGSGAALLWRAPTGLGLPVVRVLSDGTYLSVGGRKSPGLSAGCRSLINRRSAVLGAARTCSPPPVRRPTAPGAELDPTEAHLVRVVEYDVPDRVGNGTGELIVLLSTLTDPATARRRTRRRLPPALGARDRKRPAQDPPARPGQDPAIAAARARPSGDLGVAARSSRPQRPGHPRS